MSEILSQQPNVDSVNPNLSFRLRSAIGGALVGALAVNSSLVFADRAMAQDTALIKSETSSPKPVILEHGDLYNFAGSRDRALEELKGSETKATIAGNVGCLNNQVNYLAIVGVVGPNFDRENSNIEVSISSLDGLASTVAGLASEPEYPISRIFGTSFKITPDPTSKTLSYYLHVKNVYDGREEVRIISVDNKCDNGTKKSPDGVIVSDSVAIPKIPDTTLAILKTTKKSATKKRTSKLPTTTKK